MAKLLNERLFLTRIMCTASLTLLLCAQPSFGVPVAGCEYGGEVYELGQTFQVSKAMIQIHGTRAAMESIATGE